MADKTHIVIFAKGDATWLGGRQYSLNLLRALIANRDESDAYDISVLVKGKDELDHYKPFRAELRECALIERVCEDFTLSNRVRWKIKRTVFGWTNPQYEEPLLRMGATFAYPLCSARVPSASWIPDFQYYNFPDAANSSDRVERRLEAAGIVEKAQRIVLSSACAERDCHMVFPQTAGRTAVLQFRVFAESQWSVVNPLETMRKYNLPERFVLISNWLVPTKNHSFVLDSLAQVPDAERQSMHVVCTGDIYDYRNPGFYNSFLNRIHTLGLRDRVSILGVIPKHDQIQLLRASIAYLQPSLHEGWNTGVEEAHLFGKAILLSDIPVHREQAPPRTTYFNPRDPNDLSGKLRELFGLREASHSSTAAERAAVVAYHDLQLEFARSFLTICNRDLT